MGILLRQIVSQQITTKSAREIYAALRTAAAEGQSISAADVERLIKERGLEIVRDTGAMDAAIAAAIQSRPEAASDFRAGKQNAIGPLIGMIMKQVGGTDPEQMRERLIAAIQAGA